MGKDLLFSERFAGQGRVSSWEDGLNGINGAGGRGALISPSQSELPPVVFGGSFGGVLTFPHKC